MNVLFTELKEHREIIENALNEDDLTIFSHPLGKEELIMRGEDTEILSVFIYTQVTEEIIDALPDLKLIVTRSVGFDHVAAEYALDKGIEVCHIPDYGSHVVAEHVFALLLAAARNIVNADQFVKSGRKFDFNPFMGLELKDKVLGVVGTGKIGGEVIRIADGFGMNVLAYDIYKNQPLASKYGFIYVPLEELLEKSDFITLHIPLTSETHHLIDEEALGKMKEDAILINASRGGVVDTKALRESLESKHLWGAGLDVVESEEHLEDEPILYAPNVTITPHSAFFTREALKRIAHTTIEIIESFRKGEVINRIPEEYL